MIRVVLRAGSFKDYEEALKAELQGHDLVLRDIRGIVIARFRAEDVVIYGPPEMLPDDAEEGERDRGTG